MIDPRLPGLARQHPLALLVLLAVLFVGAGCELGHLARSRGQMQARGLGNAAESRCALRAQDLLSQQDAAIRDVVLATDAMQIQQAVARLAAVDLHYERTQDLLQRLLAEDPGTTPAELALMAQAKAERLAMAAPVEHVLGLARANRDGVAARVLIEDVMPHQKRLRALLDELDTAQQDQNRGLADEARTDDVVALATAATLAVLGVLLASAVLAFARRPRAVGPAAGSLTNP